MKEAKRTGKPFKKPNLGSRVWAYPVGIERKYANWLIGLLNTNANRLIAIVDKNIKRMLREYTVDSDINDWEQVAGELAESNAVAWGSTEAAVATASLYFASAIDKFNDTQWQKFVQVSIGEKFRGDEPWAQAIIEEWKTTQLSLIKNLEGHQIAKIEAIIKDAVQNGVHAVDVMKQIESQIFQMNECRAWLIARDQTTKLNSLFTKSRQIDAGFNRYTWVTFADEKVRGKPGGKYPKARPSHWEMHNRVCSWANSTVMIVDGIEVARPPNAPMVHPGMEIMCRCMAMPNLDDAFEILNNLPTSL